MAQKVYFFFKLTFEYLGAVEAVEYGVEHDLGVVAVRVELGAETVRVRDDPGVLPDYRVGRGVGHLGPPLGHPGAGQEVLVPAEGLVVLSRGVKAWNFECES